MNKDLRAFLCLAVLVGTMMSTSAAQDVTIDAGKSKNIGKNFEYLENNGTATTTGNVNIGTNQDSGTLTNNEGATLNLNHVLTIKPDSTGENSGTIKGKGSITLAGTSSFTNNEEGNLTTTSLTLQQKGTDGGAEFTNDGTSSITGAVDINGDSSLDNSGTFSSGNVTLTSKITGNKTDGWEETNSSITNSGSMTIADLVLNATAESKNGEDGKEGHSVASSASNEGTMNAGNITIGAAVAMVENSSTDEGFTTIEREAAVAQAEFTNSGVLNATSLTLQGATTGKFLDYQDSDTDLNDPDLEYSIEEARGTLTNSGSVNLSGKLTNNGNIENTGLPTEGENEGEIVAGGIIAASIDNKKDGTITGEGKLSIGGGTNNGTIEQGILENTGALTNNSSITTSTDFTNTGNISGKGSLILTAIGDDLSDEDNPIYSTGNTGTINLDSITIAGNLKNSGTITSNDTLVVGEGASIYGDGKVVVNGDGFKNLTKKTEDGETWWENADGEEVDPETVFGAEFSGDVTVGELDVNQNKTVKNDGNLTISETLHNGTGASITGDGNITIGGGYNKGTIEQNLVAIIGDVQNDKEITGNEFVNTGSLTGNGNLTIGGNGTLTNAEGEVIATGNTGTISQKDITITGNFSNTGTITSTGFFTNEGDLTNEISEGNASGGNLIVKDGANTGTISQEGLTVNGKFGNSSDIKVSNINIAKGAALTGVTTDGDTTYGSLSVNGGNIAGTVEQAIFENTGDLSNTGSITAFEEFKNTGKITGEGSLTIADGENTGSIIQKALTVSGTLDNSDATIDVTTLNINNTNGAVEGGEVTADNGTNIGTIAADILNITGNYTNNGEIESELHNSGNITGSGNITANGGDNSGSIAQNDITLTGDFNNTGSITSSGVFSNEGTISDLDENGAHKGGSLTIASGENSGSILQNALTVSGTLDNASGSIDVTTLNINNTNGAVDGGEITANNGTNIGSIAADILNITGNYNNNGEIESELHNSGNITGSGNITTDGGENSGIIEQVNITISGDFANTGSITSSGIFTNEGTISDLDENDVPQGGSLTIASGENSGEINQSRVTISGEFANDGELTVSEKLTNNGTITNSSSIIANEIYNTTTIKGDGDIEIAKGTNLGTIAQGDITLTGDFVNNGSMSSEGTFTNNANLSGEGSLAIASGENIGNITQESVTISSSFENTGSITAAYLANEGDITGEEGVLNLTNGLNSGSIDQKQVNLSGTFVNDNTIAAAVFNNTGSLLGEGGLTISEGGQNAAGAFIVQDTINIEGNFENSGYLSATDTFNNEAELTGEGTLILADGENTGSIIQKNIQIDGDFSNDSSMTSTNILITNGSLSGSGDLEVNLWANNEGAETSQNNLIVNKEFQNDGTLTITEAITNKTGASIVNNGEITTEDLTNQVGASIVNKNKFTINGTMDNKGSIVNYGDFSSNSDGTLNNEGTFISAGKDATMDFDTVVNELETSIFGATDGADLSIKSIENNGTIVISDSSTLNITEQEGELGGRIEVLIGENYLKVAGDTNDLTGTLVIGNNEENSTLILNENNIVSDAVVAVTNRGKLEFNNKDAVVVLNDNDLILGDISMKNGTLNFENRTLVTGSTSTQNGGVGPYYEQSNGNLNLNNESILVMGDSSLITGGNINIDDTSAYYSQNNGFVVDNLTSSGLIGAMNGKFENYTMDNMIIGNVITGDNQTDLTIDIYGRCNAKGLHGSDTFTANNIKNADGVESAIINISDWGLSGNLLGKDAPLDRHIYLDNLFSGEISNVTLTSTDKKVFTPIGYYQLNNHGGITGNFTLDLVEYNPQVFRGQVATVAQWMNQLAIDDMLFTHSMVLPSFKDENGKMANNYASANPLYAPYQYSRKDGGLWYKMYGTFEHLQMNNGMGSVGNNAYGSLIGADFGLKDLKNGWKFMPTAYVGYNGAHQYWSGMGQYQNGGQAGFLGTWYKDNFIVGAMAYGGVYENSMDVYGTTDNTFNYFAGTAAKASYNIRLHRDLVLQPNLMAAYNFFGQQNWHSDFGQMGMMAGMLHGVNIAPGVNLIWEKDTFSTYLTLQYMYNVNGACGGRAGHVGLPQVEMERGYIQYGIGFTKKFTDRASGYLQAVLRNVGRTGCGFQMGFNIKLGK